MQANFSPGVYKKNFSLLEKKHPDLASKLRGVLPNVEAIGEFTKSKNGRPIIQYKDENGNPLNLYSNNIEDPLIDVQAHLKTVEPASDGIVVGIGIGLGYWPLEIFRKRPSIVQMVIIEPCVEQFVATMMVQDLSDLINASHVSFLVGNLDMHELENKVRKNASLRDVHILKHVQSFQWRKELYEKTFQNVFELLNKLCASGATIIARAKELIEDAYRNMELLPHSYFLNQIKGAFQGIPAIVVSAGPSLENDLDTLRNVQDRALIITVDSSLPVLMNHGISPDFVTTIDMQKIDVEKVNCAFDRKNPFSLVAMIKCGYLMPRLLQVRQLFWAITQDVPLLWLAKLFGIEEFIPKASSVSHLALSTALLLGADPVILLGQDLAYPAGEREDHAKGTVFSSTEIIRDIIELDAIGGGRVRSDRVFLTTKTELEAIIRGANSKIINATSYGARLDGTDERRLHELNDYFSKEKIEALEDFYTRVEQMERPDRESLLRALSKLEVEIDRQYNIIKESLGIGDKIIKSIKPKRFTNVRQLEDMPAKLQQDIIKFDKLVQKVDSAMSTWGILLDLTFDALKKNDDWQRSNQRLLANKGYIDWLKGEIERICFVQKKRQEAAEFFKKYLGELMQYFRMEKKYLFNKEQYFSELCNLYAERLNIVLLSPLLDQIKIKTPEIEINKKIYGAFIKAIYGKGDEAIQIWEGDDIQRITDSGLLINKLKDLAVKEWFELLLLRGLVEEKDGYYVLLGEVLPHLLRQWLLRILRCCGSDSFCLKRLKLAWEEYKEAIQRYINLEKYNKALDILKAWDVADFELQGRDYLYALIFYRLDQLDKALEYIAKCIENGENSPDFHELAARILIESGDIDLGVKHIQKAVSLDKNKGTLWLELGDGAFAIGDFEGASLATERYLEVFPNDVQALRLLGESYNKLGKAKEAKLVLEAALQLAREEANRNECNMPEHSSSTDNIDKNRYNELFSQASQAQQAGDHQKAITFYEKAATIFDNDPNLWQNLGVSHHKLRQFDLARKAITKAISLAPDDVDPLYNLGVLCLDEKKYSEALEIFKKVLNKAPHHVRALINLGHLLLEYKHMPNDALPLFEKAVELEPENLTALYNLGNCYWALKEIDKAIINYKKAISISPDFVKAHWNLSNTLLLKGELKEGFKEYLWRWKKEEMGSPESIPVPLWSGKESIKGKVILIYAEQGAGDNIQFLRFVDRVTSLGGDVVMACQVPLIDLFQSKNGISRVINKENMHLIYDVVDFQIPLLNLPSIFEIETIEDIPCDVPYLKSPIVLIDYYKKILMDCLKGKSTVSLKIGFVWKGNPKHSNDKNRSCRFEDFLQLFDVPGTQWFSLQLIKEPLPVKRDNLFNMAPYLASFAHTAAIIEHLDLVISVDTSVAHLAGALGKPVWTLLPWLPDWRWGIEGETTPWYPTMRLIRQERPKDWDGVFNKVRVMLEELLSKKI